MKSKSVKCVAVRKAYIRSFCDKCLHAFGRGAFSQSEGNLLKCHDDRAHLIVNAVGAIKQKNIKNALVWPYR
jgi:hypothetical protein